MKTLLDIISNIFSLFKGLALWYLAFLRFIVAHKNKENYSPYKARKEKAGISLKGASIGPKRDFKPERIFEVEEANDRFADIFRNHQFECSHRERQLLAQYYHLLMKNQEHQNFTRLLKLKDVAIKHFI
ncbi:MAG: hypothetical protein ACXVBD_12745, partial [Pseudobdellovibrio sp.]